MTKLETLLYSLTIVIIRYHDSQSTVKSIISGKDEELGKKYHEYAVSLIHDKNTNAKLIEITNNCTIKIEYATRQHLLTYLHHEITFLKALLDNKISFQPEQLEKYKEQITRLFIDLRQLLNTRKVDKYNVSYSRLAGITASDAETPISLSGLKIAKFPSYSYSYCNSGNLIIQEVLAPFNLKVDSSDEEFALLAESLCTEHQNAILVSELLIENERLNKTLEGNKSELLALQQDNKTLAGENVALKKQLTQAQDELKINEVKFIPSGEILPGIPASKTIFKPTPNRFGINPGLLGIFSNHPNGGLQPDSSKGIRPPIGQ